MVKGLENKTYESKGEKNLVQLGQRGGKQHTSNTGRAVTSKVAMPTVTLGQHMQHLENAETKRRNQEAAPHHHGKDRRAGKQKSGPTTNFVLEWMKMEQLSYKQRSFEDMLGEGGTIQKEVGQERDLVCLFYEL